MQQKALLKLLMMPSLSSGLLVVAAAGALLGYDVWTYLSGNQTLFNHYLGFYDQQALYQQSASLVNWAGIFLASRAAFYILIVGAALSVGLLVFTILQLSFSGLQGAADLARAVSPPEGTPEKSGQEVLSRFLVRFVALLGWAGYSAFFVGLLIPQMFLVSHTGTSLFPQHQLSGVIYCVLTAIFVAVTLHLHVIFARLVLLRPRLFGGTDEIVEAEIEGGSQV